MEQIFFVGSSMMSKQIFFPMYFFSGVRFFETIFPYNFNMFNMACKIYLTTFVLVFIMSAIIWMLRNQSWPTIPIFSFTFSSVLAVTWIEILCSTSMYFITKIEKQTQRAKEMERKVLVPEGPRITTVQYQPLSAWLHVKGCAVWLHTSHPYTTLGNPINVYC